MRTLRNTLYISLTLQICLAAAIMAAAEEAPLPLVTVPLALLTLVVIDLGGWIQPPPLLLNLAALVSLGFAVAEFRHPDQVDGKLNQLLAGGHLIVYLTWTFLLQVKDLRRMWWMFALSVLHIALGAVLTNQPWFGAALFIYTASAVWTMSLLSLTRAALLANPHMLMSSREAAVSTGDVVASFQQHSFARNGVRTDEKGRWISPRFLGGGALTFFLTLLAGMTFFVFTPRVWIGGLNVFGDSPLRNSKGATGFTEQVKLGDIGQIMESNDLVMEIDVLDDETGLPIPPQGLADAVGAEPFFRGAVLNHYRQGAWEKGVDRVQWPQSKDSQGPIRLNITLQPINAAVLFSTGNRLGAVGLTSPTDLYYHPYTLALERRDDADMANPYSYTVSTTPPDEDSLAPPHWNDRRQNRGFRLQLQSLLETPTDRLSKLAQQVLAKSPRTGSHSSESSARILEAYLRDSGEYNYSLDLSVDDPSIDPVEDFVFNRKQGHCEYFASALALMLRGVGIPSRLISGFKGAQYNVKSLKLEVRDLHAHAWVEAFVDDRWITLDATPGERDLEVASQEEKATPNLVDKSRSFWFQGMNYSKSEQDGLVYAPLRKYGEMIRGSMAGLMQGEFPVLAELKKLSLTPRLWFSGEGGLFAFFLISLTAGAIWLARVVLRRWKGWTRRRDLAQRRLITVEFYARLLRLLQRFGLTDLETLTPREFAFRAEDQFQSRFRTAGLCGTTLALVETFYAVRFGDQTLSSDQLGQVEQQLAQLEHSLARPVAG